MKSFAEVSMRVAKHRRTADVQAAADEVKKSTDYF